MTSLIQDITIEQQIVFFCYSPFLNLLFLKYWKKSGLASLTQGMFLSWEVNIRHNRLLKLLKRIRPPGTKFWVVLMLMEKSLGSEF